MASYTGVSAATVSYTHLISAQAHSEAADNRLLRKKLQARDKRVVELEAMVSNLNRDVYKRQKKYLL